MNFIVPRVTAHGERAIENLGTIHRVADPRAVYPTTMSHLVRHLLSTSLSTPLYMYSHPASAPPETEQKNCTTEKDQKITCDATPLLSPPSLSTAPAGLLPHAADSGPASTSEPFARSTRQPPAAPRGWGWRAALLSPCGTMPAGWGGGGRGERRVGWGQLSQDCKGVAWRHKDASSRETYT